MFFEEFIHELRIDVDVRFKLTQKNQKGWRNIVQVPVQRKFEYTRKIPLFSSSQKSYINYLVVAVRIQGQCSLNPKKVEIHTYRQNCML